MIYKKLTANISYLGREMAGLGDTGGMDAYLSLFYNVHVYLVNTNKSFQK